jgi:hypothetical protein
LAANVIPTSLILASFTIGMVSKKSNAARCRVVLFDAAVR